MTVEPLPTPPHLQLVDTETGEVHEGECPGNCAETQRLKRDIKALEADLRAKRRKIADLIEERHKNLHLHPESESVHRVYALWRRTCKPRAQEEIPDDRMAMGLTRRRDFTEEQMIRAVSGAASGLAKDAKTGRVFDDWENVFRNTRNVFIYIEHAERHDAQRRREFPLGVQILDVLRAAGSVDTMRSTELDVRADCPACGGDLRLDVRSGTTICLSDCDSLEVDAALAKAAAAHGLSFGQVAA